MKVVFRLDSPGGAFLSYLYSAADKMAYWKTPAEMVYLFHGFEQTGLGLFSRSFLQLMVFFGGPIWKWMQVVRTTASFWLYCSNFDELQLSSFVRVSVRKTSCSYFPDRILSTRARYPVIFMATFSLGFYCFHVKIINFCDDFVFRRQNNCHM